MRARHAAVLFAVLTILMTWPVASRPATTTLSSGPDGELFVWTLAWDAHALLHHPASIFDANIYHPLRRTLAYSENLIGSALVAAPVIWLTGSPVLALNAAALLSCALCGLGAFVLARRAGLGTPGAVVAGLVFAFSPPRFFRTSQLHVGVVPWLPFALASLHAYFDRGRARDLRLTAAFFSLQALASGHGAAFAIVAMLAFILYRLARGAAANPVRRLRDLGVTGALLLLPAVLVYLPYRAVQRETGLRRTLENWAVTPASFLASPTHVHAWLASLAPGARILEDASAYLFPGVLPLLLAAAALLFGIGDTFRFPWSSRRQDSESVTDSGSVAPSDSESVTDSRSGRGHVPTGSVLFYGLLALLGLWLSIGPPLGLWPLVYWLPGMSLIRVPSRFTVLAVLGLAILAGAGADRLLARVPSRRRSPLLAAVGILLLAEFAAMPMTVSTVHADAPLADRWLATRPGPFAVAEVPLPDPGNASAFERRQTMYMLHSMAHWQKTVHGYSGWRAPLHEQLYVKMRGFPDEDSLRELARLGVTYVVVHTELCQPGEWPQVEARIEAFGGRLQLEHVAGAGRVYSLRGAGAADAPRVP